MRTILLSGFGCAVFMALPALAKSDGDACKLLTAAQVSAAAGFTVSEGTHVTPTFVKTCTWTGSNSSGAQFVTLNLQTAAFFDGAKKQAAMITAAGGSVKPAGVGDDSYFLIEGTQVMLWVKKGDSAFKLAVYKQIAPGQKQDIESTLAKEVVPRL